MPKIKITQDQMLAVYLERILKDKGEWAEDAQEQKRQIKRMQEDIGNVLGERAISELEQRIEDKKKFIDALKEILSSSDVTEIIKTLYAKSMF